MSLGRILIVDDDQNICELLRLYVEKEGYDATIAGDGREALTKFQALDPILILLDIMLPELDGWQVCREIRKTSRCPIIMLTAKGEVFDKILGLELGADDYVVKPFNNRELLARIKNTLIRLDRSRGANPLTGLRGNNDIEMEIAARIATGENFAVLYMDLNSFKPYNDIYGFANGDIAIKLSADIICDAAQTCGMPTDFVGHIGGDDFVVISSKDTAVPIAQYVIDVFDERILELYTPEDREKGYIVAKDRAGNTTQFGFIGMSVAIVYSDRYEIKDLIDLAEVAAKLKKVAKAKAGGKSAYAFQ